MHETLSDKRSVEKPKIWSRQYRDRPYILTLQINKGFSMYTICTFSLK